MAFLSSRGLRRRCSSCRYRDRGERRATANPAFSVQSTKPQNNAKDR